MMKQTKKAFTLVELIIVITILAILATIGFMSYQSYTSDARNSKRTNDLSALQSKLEIIVAKNATAITSFASGITANQLANTFSAGSGTVLSGSTVYNAGDVNYTAFGVSQNDFSDPSSTSSLAKAYKFAGAVTSKGNIYQFVATLEATSDQAKQSLVKGVFLTGGTDTAQGLVDSITTAGSSSNSGIVNAATSDFAY
ncbi:MAG: type II secretion system protein [Candidatus Gracilibacteria bacterium]|nr:type II secretion system protein [Candidatus Gracilibacteria bacterium]